MGGGKSCGVEEETPGRGPALHGSPEAEMSMSRIVEGGWIDGQHLGSRRAPWPGEDLALYSKYLWNYGKLKHIYLVFRPVLFIYLRL